MDYLIESKLIHYNLNLDYSNPIFKIDIQSNLLVNKIMNYPIEHFIRYTMYVQWHMLNRGYKLEFEKFTKYFDFTYEDYYDILAKRIEDIFVDWHNDRYLVQCLCNLQEKYDCGGVPEEEWLVIANRFDEEMRFCP